MAMTKREKMDLDVAQMRVREAEERIKVLFGNSPTNTFLSFDHLKYQPLTPNAHIKFELPGLGNTIYVRIQDGLLVIMGEHRIEILPGAANSVKIRCVQ